MHDYDVIIIGGGSAGTSAARAAKAAGARVLMINDGELGGLCILRGCMPTKAMLASAHAIHEAKRLEPFGARLEGRVVPDFSAIVARKNAHVERFKRAKIRSIENGGYDVLDARARFGPGGVIETSTGRTLRAKSVVIATGSVPHVPPIPGLEDVPYWTSDDVMRLADGLPRSLVVQGAGPIGLELAQFFARVGTEVTLVNRSPLLTRFDAADMGEDLAHALSREMTIVAPGCIRRVTRAGDGIRFEIEDAAGTVRTHEADAFLVAAGRHAAIEGLGLEHAGIAVSGRTIVTDAALRTTNPRVFVAGDATNDYEILHIANQEGTVAGHNAAGGTPERHIDYRLLMGVIFTEPCFAHVGLTEGKAAAAGRDVVVGRARFPETGRAITMSVLHGSFALIVDRGTREIVGAKILGPRADDLIHVLSTLLHFRATIDTIFDLPWYHPTLTEVILDVARDARAQLGG